MMQRRMSLNGVSFRWDQDRLIVTVQGDQHILSGSEAARLLDFLLSYQQPIYAAQQTRELPDWIQELGQEVNGHVELPQRRQLRWLERSKCHRLSIG